MKLTKIRESYVREEIKRDCQNLHYVELYYGEIEMIHNDRPTFDAIVGCDPQNEDRWVCLAINGRITWSRGYKTIATAIKNANFV